MNSHYSDYLKKSVPADSLIFDKVTENDRELIKSVRKAHINANKGFLALLIFAFIVCAGFFICFLMTPFDSIVYEVVTLAVTGSGAFGSGSAIYNIIGGIKGIRRGVVLTAERIGEMKDNRNATYQYVLDIYLEDRDELFSKQGRFRERRTGRRSCCCQSRKESYGIGRSGTQGRNGRKQDQIRNLI